MRLEKLQMWAARQLPRWLTRWAFIGVVTHATTGIYSSAIVPELSAMDALRRWEAA